MKQNKWVKDIVYVTGVIFVSLLFYSLIVFIFAFPFLFAWNYVMPDFGLPKLTYLKLISICFIIFFVINMFSLIIQIE